MNAQNFWNVIANYNTQTKYYQVSILLILITACIISYKKKLPYLIKLSLGLANLFIGFVFFGIYGTEPIQKFFALPLYILTGFLFIHESIKNKNDTFTKPNTIQKILLILFIVYPLISLLLNNRFPQMVVYIMPCPIITVSIALYMSYKKKNKLLLILLCIWGLTGIKSVIFKAYEDIILLLAGIYCLTIIRQENKNKRTIS